LSISWELNGTIQYPVFINYLIYGGGLLTNTDGLKGTARDFGHEKHKLFNEEMLLW